MRALGRVQEALLDHLVSNPRTEFVGLIEASGAAPKTANKVLSRMASRGWVVHRSYDAWSITELGVDILFGRRSRDGTLAPTEE